MQFPDFIIAGECKCGTTSMYHDLVKHPKILESFGNGIDNHYLGTKEIRFFDRYWDKGIDWYKSCFPKCEPGCITGEASPEYFSRSLCLHRMEEILPANTKVIISIRNPVDRLYSHYHHMKKWISGWNKKYSSFEDFINCAREEDYYLIEKGIYSKWLYEWYTLFNNVHIVVAEDLFEKPQETYNKLFDFLGMEHHKISKFEKLRGTDREPMKKETRKYLEGFYHFYNEDLRDYSSANIRKWY
jgi:hypothetical protein